MIIMIEMMMMIVMMMIEMTMMMMMMMMMMIVMMMIEMTMMMHSSCDLFCRPVRDLRGRATASQRSGPPVVLPSRLLPVPQLVSSRTQAVSVTLPREQTPFVL